MTTISEEHRQTQTDTDRHRETQRDVKMSSLNCLYWYFIGRTAKTVHWASHYLYNSTAWHSCLL